MRLPIGNRRALALLAYLAVTGKRVSRARVAEFLRPGLPSKTSRAALRRALHELRKAIGPSSLVADFGSLELVRNGSLEVDVWTFRERLAECLSHGHGGHQVCPRCEKPLREALDLYQGSFLSGFGLADSPAMDSWQAETEEAFRQEVVGCLERLIRLGEASPHGRVDEEPLRRWLALDPLSEKAHRAAMRACAASGRRAEAEARFLRCSLLLRTELGVEPDAETLELLAAIRKGEPPPPPADGPELTGWSDRGEETGEPRAERADLPSLPTPSTPFFGREAELATLRSLIEHPGCRLLNLKGPGGVGKTRLALELGRKSAEAFAGRVAFVPLVAVSSAERILPACADAIGLAPDGGRPLVEQFLEFLGEWPFLLILDNFEHLAAEVDLIQKILERCPAVQLVLTSRKPVRLRQERLYRLQGLRHGDGAASEPGSDDEARAFFLACAQRLDPDFEPRGEQARAMSRICTLTEGNPLALELAAAWCHMLQPFEIAERIARSLDLLTSPLRDVSERHRSLKAVFDHSLAALDEAERRAFADLTVFRGGFSREAAARVAGADPVTLASLVDKSLLQSNERGIFQIHELLRQYAGKELARDPERKARVERSYSVYYLDLLRRWGRAFQSREVGMGLELLGHEIENLRTAWREACTLGWVRELGDAMVALHYFHEISGRFEEGRALLEEAIGTLRRVAPERGGKNIVLGRALVLGGWLSSRCGCFRQAAEDLAEAEAIFTSTEACLEKARAGLAWGMHHHLEGRYRDAEQRYRAGLDQARESGQLWYEAHIQTLLGFLHYDLGAHVEARIAAQRAVEISRDSSNLYALAWALMILGNLARLQGTFTEAEVLYRRGLQASRQLGRHNASGFFWSKLGTLARYLGDFREAERRYRQALAFFEARAHRPGVIRCLNNLARLAEARGDLEVTRRRAERALASSEVPRSLPAIAFSLANLGGAHLRQGQLDQAEELLGKSLKIYEAMGYQPRIPWVRCRLAQALWLLGEREAGRAHLRSSWSEAEAMSATLLMLEAAAAAAHLAAGSGDEEGARALGRHILRHACCPREIAEPLREALGALGSDLLPEPSGSPPSGRLKDLFFGWLETQTPPGDPPALASAVG